METLKSFEESLERVSRIKTQGPLPHVQERYRYNESEN